MMFPPAARTENFPPGPEGGGSSLQDLEELKGPLRTAYLAVLEAWREATRQYGDRESPSTDRNRE